MPTITPVLPEGTITLTPSITPPSKRAAPHLTSPQAPIHSLSQPEVKETAPSPLEKLENPPLEIKAETSPQDSVRIAALIRREKQLLQRAKILEEREKKIQETQSQYKPWQEASELAKTNKIEALKKLGMTYDELTQAMLQNQEPQNGTQDESPAQIARREIEAFKKEQLELTAKEQKRQYEQSIANINAEVQTFVESSDKYPLVKETNAYQDITRDIEQTFYRTGKILTAEQAVSKMESDIREGLELLQSAIKPKEAPEQVAPEVAKAPTPAAKVTTLTHKTTQAAPSVQPLTDAEKRQRAIDAFYGKLA